MRQYYNIAFFGTPRFATLILDELEATHLLPSLIVTKPDTPQGRGMVLTSPETKRWGEAHGIDVVQPERVKEADFLAELKNSEWDIFIVAAYGKILPQELLSIPRRGTLNVHASLLPKFRGASPIQAQILADTRGTGVTIMLIDEEMDHGPIIAQASIDLEEPIDVQTLTDLMAHEGGKLLAEVIPDWVAGKIHAVEQDHAQASYTKKVEKGDGLLRDSDTPREKYLKYLAYTPWPGAYFFADRGGKKVRLRITEALWENDTFVIKKVVPEGKTEVAFETFLKS
jgi:methionyl-tRNA formyltransferase